MVKAKQKDFNIYRIHPFVIFLFVISGFVLTYGFSYAISQWVGYDNSYCSENQMRELDLSGKDPQITFGCSGLTHTKVPCYDKNGNIIKDAICVGYEDPVKPTYKTWHTFELIGIFLWITLLYILLEYGDINE